MFRLSTRLLLCALLVCAIPAFADPPPGYYESAEGLDGDELKAALHDIIDQHDELRYQAAYDALKVLDRDPDQPEMIVGFYSGFRINAADEFDEGDGWTPEHVWPSAFGDFGTRKGAGTDLHNLRAADVSMNQLRSNRSFAEGGAEVVDEEGTHSGFTECRKGIDAWTWEPPDQVKGDVARAVMYMAVRYAGDDPLNPDLEMVETVQSDDSKAPELGVLSQLLRWHAEDPVDEAERRRNDLIYDRYQGNRNAFVDRPDFAETIWILP